MQSSQKSGKKTLFILAVVFILPFTLAATLHLVGWKASWHSYGELVQPPQSLQFTDLQDSAGKPFDTKRWEKKWTIVSVANACESACQAQQQTLQKLRISLGKDLERVQQVLLIPAETKSLPQHDEFILLAGAQVAGLASQFDMPGRPAAESGQTYLVDPLGNLMMSYPADYDPKGMRKDLLRLLKNSWAG